MNDQEGQIARNNDEPDAPQENFPWHLIDNIPGIVPYFNHNPHVQDYHFGEVDVAEMAAEQLLNRGY